MSSTYYHEIYDHDQYLSRTIFFLARDNFKFAPSKTVGSIIATLQGFKCVVHSPL